MTAKNANYINHIAFVLDASYSMQGKEGQVIRAADEQIKYLAQRSTELDQETRVTVYTFADDVQCHIYDKDVLRLPSLKDVYKLRGNTALIDATMLSIEDLQMQPEKYGDHSFLVFAFTDGQENRSRKHSPRDLQLKLDKLPDHWTVAALVPDLSGEQWAKRVGFTAGNVAQWDTKSKAGLDDSFSVIRAATDNFMTARTKGVRGTRSLFSTGIDAVNSTTVQSLTPLSKGKYDVLYVGSTSEIKPFVASHTGYYRTGSAFYQLTKTETIQANKKIAIMRKRDGMVFTGSEARDILGLPLVERRVKPDYNPEYTVFVQSTSVNRKLVPGTNVLVLS